MRFFLPFALLLAFQQPIFAQNYSNESESDSLFKLFLMKSKGVKFNQPNTKDTIITSTTAIDNVTKTTAKQAQTVKPSTSKTDTTKIVKPKIVEKTETKALPKSNTAVKDSTQQKVKAKTTKTDTISAGVPPAGSTQKENVTIADPPKTTKIAGLHKFKEAGSSYALEAERKGTIVKLYLRMEDIEQYAEVVLVRGAAELGSFTDVRHIEIIKGANKYEYVETEDRYPLSTKTAAAYKVRAVTKDGAIRTFPAITLEPGIK